MKIIKLANALPRTHFADKKPRANVKKTVRKGSALAKRGTSANGTQHKGGREANVLVMDAFKIAEIKQAIREGRFQINSSAVADSLIEVMRSFRRHKG